MDGVVPVVDHEARTEVTLGMSVQKTKKQQNRYKRQLNSGFFHLAPFLVFLDVYPRSFRSSCAFIGNAL